MSAFPVDRAQLAIFADALFRYASPGHAAQLRGFYDGTSKLFGMTPVTLGSSLGPLVERAHEMAQRAADEVQPVVFCSPIAAFAPHAGRPWHAGGGDVTEGLALSVECDIRPAAARGNPGAAARASDRRRRASGGEWADPETGEVQQKLHVHFRLSEPATGDNLSQLRRARGLAAAVVGGDASNVPVAHPIRWRRAPGTKARGRRAWPRSLNSMKGPSLSSAMRWRPSRKLPLGSRRFRQLRRTARSPGGPVEGSASGAAVCRRPSPTSPLARRCIKSIADLAARLVPCGLAGGAAVNMLRGAMEGLTPLERRDDRWRARYDDIPRAVSTAQDKYVDAAGGIAPFPETAPQSFQPSTLGQGGTIYPLEAPDTETSPDVGPTPIDLWQEWPTPPFPLDALPPVVRRFCELQAQSSGADVSGYAIAALGAASGAINHGFTLKMKRTGAWLVRPRLWVLLIGLSSSLKTPIISACLAPLRARASELAARRREDLQRYTRPPRKPRSTTTSPSRTSRHHPCGSSPTTSPPRKWATPSRARSAGSSSTATSSPAGSAR